MRAGEAGLAAQLGHGKAAFVHEVLRHQPTGRRSLAAKGKGVARQLPNVGNVVEGAQARGSGRDEDAMEVGVDIALRNRSGPGDAVAGLYRGEAAHPRDLDVADRPQRRARRTGSQRPSDTAPRDRSRRRIGRRPHRRAGSAVPGPWSGMAEILSTVALVLLCGPRPLPAHRAGSPRRPHHLTTPAHSRPRIPSRTRKPQPHNRTRRLTHDSTHRTKLDSKFRLRRL
jgi:hypothetical protein